jgi:hypothetical protein
MNYCILKTDIKGICVFSNKLYKENEIIGEYIGLLQNNNGRILANNMYESEILGRYCNHSDTPNTKLFKIEDGSIILLANQTIRIGDEIVTNYIDVECIINVPFLTYYKHHFTNTKLFNFGKN